MKGRNVTIHESIGARLMAGCVALAFCVWTGAAAADDVSGAAAAYSRAQQAALTGDHAKAAELFELADSLAPAPEALRSALRSRMEAGQLKAAAGHAETLLQRYPDDEKSRELAQSTLDEVSGQFLRYEVECSPTACLLEVDGAAVGTESETHHIVYMDPGAHEVVAVFGSQRTNSQLADGLAGERATLTFEAPPIPSEPGEAEKPSVGAAAADPRADVADKKKGLSPGFFAVAGIATLGLGGATLWSGLDVLAAHDEYEKNQTQKAYEDGLDKQRRTNILIGATAAAGAATVVFAILTKWKSDDSAVRAGVDVGSRSGIVTVSGTY